MTGKEKWEEDFRLPLYPFQRRGVQFLDQSNGRAILGDEMGLGKTIQVLAWLKKHPEALPAIVVCPASLKLNWDKEIKKCTDFTTQIISGKRPTAVNHRSDIVIINYDIVFPWRLFLSSRSLVLDECHLIKNLMTKRTKGVRFIAKMCKYIIAVSGTPITSRPSEFYSTISMVRPGLFTLRYYRWRFCAPKHNGFAWTYKGASNTAELHRIVSSFMIRRLKREVLPELPTKVRSIIPLQMDPKARKEYVEASTNFISWVVKNKGVIKAQSAIRAMAFTKVEYLKQIVVKGKMSQMLEWMSDYIDDYKLVLFGTHIDVLENIHAHFQSQSVLFTGRLNLQERAQAVRSFQERPSKRLFIGQIKAAGVGITLTAANAVCFAELGWTPGEHDQAEDRIHRIGQTADSINAYYLLAQNTIEEDIAQLIDDKRQVITEILDGKDAEQESLLTELLKRLEKKR